MVGVVGVICRMGWGYFGKKPCFEVPIEVAISRVADVDVLRCVFYVLNVEFFDDRVVRYGRF